MIYTLFKAHAGVLAIYSTPIAIIAPKKNRTTDIFQPSQLAAD
jgi:hypothetical protein